MLNNYYDFIGFWFTSVIKQLSINVQLVSNVWNVSKLIKPLPLSQTSISDKGTFNLLKIDCGSWNICCTLPFHLLYQYTVLDQKTSAPWCHHLALPKLRLFWKCPMRTKYRYSYVKYFAMFLSLFWFWFKCT